MATEMTIKDRFEGFGLALFVATPSVFLIFFGTWWARIHGSSKREFGLSLAEHWDWFVWWSQPLVFIPMVTAGVIGCLFAAFIAVCCALGRLPT